MSDGHTDKEDFSQRLVFAAIGAGFGLAGYALFDYLRDIETLTRAHFWIAMFVYGGFASFLFLIGIVPLKKAIIPALSFTVLVSLLMLWASFRFAEVEAFFKSGHPFAAFAALFLLGIPFLLARFGTSKGWFDYDTLFEQAWGLFMRIVLANLFAWLSFGILWLCAYLLKAVNLSFFEEALKEPWIACPLFGAIFGLALAVVLEMQNVISMLRFLVLRLLRLLMPVIAVFSLLFLIMVPFQGISNLFGRLSTARMIMLVAFFAIAFVSAAVDGRDELSTKSKFMTLCARGLCVLLPFLAGIALWAIVLRIADYGWTPDRLVSVILAVVIFVYALGYLLAASNKFGDWKPTLRRVNVGVALLALGLSALWLTPILNAERISTNSQVGRLISKGEKLQALPLWEMKKDWGNAGLDGLERVSSWVAENGDEQTKSVLAKFNESDSRWSWKNQADKETPTKVEQRKELAELIPIVPKDRALSAEYIAAIRYPDRILKACESKLKDNYPSCVAIIAELDASHDGEEVVILYLSNATSLRSAVLSPKNRNISLDLEGAKPDEILLQILTQGISLEPSGLQDISIGKSRIGLQRER